MAFSGKVAVLMGGIGSERDVSLCGGKNVANALRSEGIDVLCVDITPQDISILDDKSIDVFFVMLHGRWGEDGQLQQIMEEKGLKFTGSGSVASKLSFDKVRSKEVYKSAGLPTPWWLTVEGNSDWIEVAENLENQGEKFVVKPACEGSSMGVELVDRRDDTIAAAKKCVAKFGKTLIEQYVEAREFTVGLLNGQPLPVIEICLEEGFYDYDAKYVSDSTQYLFDTINDEKIVEEMQECAVKCFKASGCEGFARVDFLLSPQGEFYILEINTIPGFTSHSLLPKAAQKHGLSQGRLCVEIVESVI